MSVLTALRNAHDPYLFLSCAVRSPLFFCSLRKRKFFRAGREGIFERIFRGFSGGAAFPGGGTCFESVIESWRYF